MDIEYEEDDRTDSINFASNVANDHVTDPLIVADTHTALGKTKPTSEPETGRGKQRPYS